MILEPIPRAITQLRLRYSFRQYNPSILDCIDSTTDANAMVIDDEEQFYSHFTNQEEEQYRCVIVNNVKRHEIYLLAIDNRFISNYPGGVADCALFDESQFNFVEFKTNAEGHTLAQVEKTYRDAMAQIGNTFQLFKKNCQKRELISRKLSIFNVLLSYLTDFLVCLLPSSNFN